MKVLVTGGAGFIGSHVVDLLFEAGHEVAIVDNLWEHGGGRIENVNPMATFYQIDVRDEALAEVFETEHPEVVCHLAAQHSVKISTDMPVYDAQGRFDGVVATNLELQRLTEALVTIGREQGTERGVQVTIVDAVGQIIAHSQPEKLLQMVLDDLPGVRQSLAGEQGSLIATDADGREWVYSYAAIPTAGWGVVVQRPTQMAFATSQSFHRGLLIALGLFVIGASLFWWGLTRRVIRPLEQLTRFSEVVGLEHYKELDDKYGSD